MEGWAWCCDGRGAVCVMGGGCVFAKHGVFSESFGSLRLFSKLFVLRFCCPHCGSDKILKYFHEGRIVN